MIDYVYKDPRSVGFQKFKLTTKDHNSLFKYSKDTWKTHYEYYLSDDCVEIHRFSSVWVKIFNTIIFPIVMVFAGLSNYKDVFKEYRYMYHEKKYGAFVLEVFWRGNTENTYTHIIKMVVK